MTSKTTISINLEGREGIPHIADNRGNSISLTSNPFDPAITCGGEARRVNQQRLGEVLGTFNLPPSLSGPKGKDLPSEHDWEAPTRPPRSEQVPNPAMPYRPHPDGLRDAAHRTEPAVQSQHLDAARGAAEKIASIVQNVSSGTVILRDGIESPLTALCNAGQSSGLLER